MSPSGAYYASGLDPVNIYVETNYVRAVRGGMGFTKTGGNYAASLIGQDEAHKQNYSQVLWLDVITIYKSPFAPPLEPASPSPLSTIV